jgi:galactokinase
VNHVPLAGEISIVLARSNARHALVEGEYNTRRADCEAAARALGVPALRDTTLEALTANRAKLGDRIYRRALHVVGENQRVVAGAEMLRRNDFAGFGELMFASHESSRINFENSCPELDDLVATARKIAGVYGARLSGGGFGGSTINLVRKGREKEVVRALTAFVPGTECLVTSAADGALAARLAK